MRYVNKLESVPFVMIAFNTDTNENELELLRRHGFSSVVSCDGVWEGTKEKSYAVFFENVEQLQTLVYLAKRYTQEAILIVDSDRNAELLNLITSEKSKVGNVGS